MRVQIFRNKKGLIHGSDSRRIGCDRDGILKIGTAEFQISAAGDSVLPLLFHGASGDYRATFTDSNGNVYELEKVAVRGGRIAPPSPTAIEYMELQCRADETAEELKAVRKKMHELENIFDTNSLNFLIG